MWWLSVILAAVIVVLPRLLVLLCSKVKLFGTLGPIFLCLACGILLGIPLNLARLDTSVATTFVNYTVPIAIPLVLFSADYRPLRHMAKPALLSFVLVIVSVMAAAVGCYFLFRGALSDMPGLSGMMVGLYTGGTPNLFAIGKALAVSDSHITLAVASDTLVGGVYFVMLLSFMPALIHKLLPLPKHVPAHTDAPAKTSLFAAAGAAITQEVAAPPEADKLFYEYVPGKKRFSIRYLLRRVPILLLAAASFLVSAGLAYLILGDLDNPWVVVVVMLGVTTCGIALSFVRRVRTAPGSFAAGQYFIYMFSVAMGLSLDLSALKGEMLLFVAVFAAAQFGAIALHLLLCRLFRIDGHTAIITSTAGIYGPAFVTPVAASFRDPGMVLPGLLCGILGYAVGNYLGFAVGTLLALI